MGDKEGSDETIKNIDITRNDAIPKFDPFQ